MKLLALGCLHGKVPPTLKKKIKEDYDALLYAGDLINSDALRTNTFSVMQGKPGVSKKKYKQMVKEAVLSSRVVCNFFRAFRKPVFLVWGNNDYTARDLSVLGIRTRGIAQRLPKNVLVMKNDIVLFNGVYIAGFSGYLDFIKKKDGYQRDMQRFAARLNKLFAKITYPRKTLFLTHDVPYGKFDIVKWKASPAFGQHVGERLFNKALRHKHLAAMLCAHMHEYQGFDQLYKTLIINTGYGRKGKCVELNIENGKITKVNFFK